MLCRCDTCTCLYAVGLAACPQCGADGWTLVDSGGEPVRPDFEPGPQPVKAEAEPAAAAVKAKAGKADA